ncbi:signal peptidase I [Paenibacillus sp. RC67]|uniref:signal peptidase I n=1 Tax=Paenibacillus sp. RC67 TaxID=3039392 RepID=UPI0024AE257D|nr:signal peptidase I [Paenibacillus sp. RC67]
MRISVSIVMIALLLAGCSEGIIQDNITKQEIVKIKDMEGMQVYDHQYDNMDRGHHELDGVPIVVDPAYYEAAPIQRGDIVYYRNPKLDNPTLHLSEFEISRVVALPGETIHMEKGQIYINGKQLDTFYGKAHRLGMDVEQLQKLSNQSDVSDNVRQSMKMNAEEILLGKDTNRTEKKVPNDQYYIIGDDWFRSADSRHFGTIAKDNILGKVVGITSE